MNTELTVGQLRRILRTAPADATVAEGLEDLADAERREAADMEHGVRVSAYNEYLERRREREREHVQHAADDWWQSTRDVDYERRSR